MRRKDDEPPTEDWLSPCKNCGHEARDHQMCEYGCGFMIKEFKQGKGMVFMAGCGCMRFELR